MVSSHRVALSCEMVGRAESVEVPVSLIIRMSSWLLSTRSRVSNEMTGQLKNGLFPSVPIFLGGVLNATSVAAIAALRHPTPAFIGWLLFEIGLGLVRTFVLIHGKKLIAANGTPSELVSAIAAP